MEARAREDVQDAEIVRVSAYAGLRRGELVALHWRDVDFVGRKQWVQEVKDAKPSTVSGYRYLLSEPGTPHRRGHGRTAGFIMAALGDRPAASITTRDVEGVLHRVAAPRQLRVLDDRGRPKTVTARAAPRTVNQHRQLLCAIFNYAMRPSTYGLQSNPAKFADRRREPERGPLAFYTTAQIEGLARAMADGAHRDPDAPEVGEDERAARAVDDARDAELIRVAAYTGLRRGELIALRWADIDFTGHKLTVRRAISAGVEAASTKSRRAREVPLPDQAGGALDRLSRRSEFVGPDEYVFANRLGRRLDPTALRRRFERARNAAGLPPLRFHDLRHTYGSLLVAGGVDLQSAKAAMGHSRITTTERYLHARPATEQAARFTRAFGSAVSVPSAPVDVR
ncbi:MAG: tyrosine-type recombinase/integrase [Solirubrobacterales bacterium]|nr:tyrosine-type recombinase/integrase [Solirubrobacterales bacterium]